MGIVHYAQIRESLLHLADGFDAFAQHCGFLNHELLFAPEGTGSEPDTWCENDFDSLRTSTNDSGWQEFKLSNSKRQCSRYWSIEDYSWVIPNFELMCERGWRLLMSLAREHENEMPLRFCVDRMVYSDPTQISSGAEQWLAAVHEFAFRFPVVGLHGECRWRYFGDTQCVSNILFKDVATASASFIELVTNTDYVADLSGWDGQLELELPEPEACEQSNADLTIDGPDEFPLSVDIEHETITIKGVVYQLDQQLAAVVQILIDANGEIRSQSDMKKAMPIYCLDTRLDLTIKRNLKAHQSGIGEFVESSRKGFRLRVEALTSLTS